MIIKKTGESRNIGEIVKVTIVDWIILYICTCDI